MRAKQSATMRGQKKSPEHITAQLAASKASGGYQRFREASLVESSSIKGSAIRSLSGRMHNDRQARPTSTQLEEWAMPVSERLGLPIEAVLAIWRSWLRERGLFGSPKGRPQEIDYAQIIESRAAGEKWIVIASRLGRSEGTLKNGLRQWLRRQAEK